MDVYTQAPLHDKYALKDWLEQRMPNYKVIVRGPSVIVGSGPATGVIVKPGGPGLVRKMPWAFPNMGVQILVVLPIFVGLLPGLLAFLITWLVAKGGVDRLRAEVAQVLQSGQPLGGGQMAPQLGYQPAAAGAYGQAGYDPAAQAHPQSAPHPHGQQGYPGYPQQGQAPGQGGQGGWGQGGQGGWGQGGQGGWGQG